MSSPIRRAPKVAPSFNWNRDGLPTQNQYGNHIFLPTVEVAVRRPTWNGTETVFRPFPSLDYNDPSKFEPYRIDLDGEMVFGNWIRRYECAWMIGASSSITYLVRNPSDEQQMRNPRDPLTVLQGAISDAVRSGQEQAGFGALLNGGAGKNKPLDRPKSVYLMQGMLMVHNSELQYGEGKCPPGFGDNRPCVLMLSGGRSSTSTFSLGPKVKAMLDEENQNFGGDPYDFENRYVCGDPVDPAKGRFIQIFEAGSDPNERYRARPQQSRGPAAWRNQGPQRQQQQQTVSGYDVRFLTELHDGTPSSLDAEDLRQNIRDKWLWWEEVLHFPSFQEQAFLLNGVFAPNVIVYAFENEFSEWITEETWSKYTARVSVMPGGHDAPQYGHRGNVPQPPPPPPGVEREFRTPARTPGGFLGGSPQAPRQGTYADNTRTQAPSFSRPAPTTQSYPGESAAFGGDTEGATDLEDSVTDEVLEEGGEEDSFDQGVAETPSVYSRKTSSHQDAVVPQGIPDQPAPVASTQLPAETKDPRTSLARLAAERARAKKK